MKLTTETLEYKFEDVTFDASACYYCGSVATTIDHVPPRSTRSMYENSAAKCPYPYYEVPACAECNYALSDKFHTLRERKRHIVKWLENRYSNLLIMPQWAENELSTMSLSMQTMIRDNERTRAVIEERIRWARRGVVAPVKIKPSPESKPKSKPEFKIKIVSKRKSKQLWLKTQQECLRWKLRYSQRDCQAA